MAAVIPESSPLATIQRLRAMSLQKILSMAQFLRRSWIQSSIIEQLKECKQELHNQLVSSDIDDRFEFCQSSFKNLQNPGRAQIIRVCMFNRS